VPARNRSVSSEPVKRPTSRSSGSRADYGVDEPRVPAILALAGVACLGIGLVSWRLGFWPGLIVFALAGISGLAGAASYMYTTLRGKHRAWSGILDSLDLEGGELVLDVGCGRGAVLLAAARRLPRGQAVGIDIWTRDQSGNSAAATRRNALAEQVAGRVQLATADARHLPFGAGTFDLVFSSIVIHNMHSAEDRRLALAQAFRVLKPGGQLVIADIFTVGAYPDELTRLGARSVSIRSLGPGAWFGNPFIRARLVEATK
jgi:SAM-dependent methyltransferase